MTAKKSSRHLDEASRPATGSHGAAPGADDELGRALRMVYGKTLDEHIPEAMLDLLKKLG